MYDIVCLTETKLDNLDIIEDKEFIFLYKNRKKISNYKSGGIALGYKKELENFIIPVETDSSFVFWFSVKKDFLELKKDLIFGIIYIPPENTIYTSTDAFSEIELEYQKFNKNSNYICLVGDFNSRTANFIDFYEDLELSELETNNLDVNEFSDVHILDELCIPRYRNSPDNIVNSYGRKSLEFCKNNNLFILNGRIGKDKTGRPTSKKSSVIDYMITTAHFFKLINDFEILDFSKLFSDIHSPLSIILSSKIENCRLIDSSENKNSPNIGK
ncbi:unnamed protein product [Mytilus coruscus]|uniref:Endonuclease/exonuclease/phosphatase domain-containing protein n=1 Tax=Mytilus coruscus TaxID=42192 RepID=A0A6J8DV06_MYTCO|nr:unnamed protein product [Mytilus coruscus]